MNPPHSSHHGGVYEQRICSVRRIFEASLQLLGKRGLARDDFITLLLVSNDPEDPLPLSPAMLLTQREHPNAAPIEIFSESDLDSYGPRRYRRVQYLADQFWTLWRKEHLHQLTLRRKWQKPTRCFAKGDLVLVRNILNPRNNWETGVVLEVFPITDRLVRSVKVSLPPRSGEGARRTQGYP